MFFKTQTGNKEAPFQYYTMYLFLAIKRNVVSDRKCTNPTLQAF